MAEEIALKVNNSLIRCSKHLLMEKSDYFKAMFTSNMKESMSAHIELKGFSPEVIQSLVDSLTGPIELNEDCMFDIIEAAVMYQFKDLLVVCCVYLEQILSSANCLSIMTIADMFSLSTVYHKAKTHALWHFEDVVKETEIYELSEKQIVEYLSHHALNCSKEMNVFEVACKWFHQNIHDLIPREQNNRVLSTDLEQGSATLKDITPNKRVRVDQEPCESILDASDSELKEQSDKSSSKETPAQAINPPEDRTLDCNSAFVVQNAHPITSDTITFAELLQKCVFVDMMSQVDLQKILQCPLVINDEQSKSLILESVEKKKTPTRIQEPPVMQERMPPFSIMCFGGHVCSTLPCCKPDQCEGNSAPKDYLLFSPEDCTFRADPLPANADSHLGDTALHMIGCQVTLVDKYVIVTGGEAVLGKNKWQMTMMAFDCFDRSWIRKRDLRQPRRHHGACAVDRQELFLIGGFGRFRKILNNVESYNVLSDSWFDHPPMLQPEFSASVAACNNSIYVFKTQIQKYSLTTRDWSFITIDQPISTNVNFAMTHDNCIYLCCKFHKTLRLYCPESNDCQEIGHFMNECKGCVMHQGKIFWFEDYTHSPDVECYDLRTRQFKLVANMKNCFLAGEILSVPTYPIFYPSAHA